MLMVDFNYGVLCVRLKKSHFHILAKFSEAILFDSALILKEPGPNEFSREEL